MKLYVDELPKNCKECPLYRSGKLKIQKRGRYVDADTCVLGNFYKFQEIDNEIDTCPLQTIKQLKQSIIENIKHRLAKQRTKMRDDNHCYLQTVIHWQDIVAILGQMKGEDNVKD